MHVPFGTIDIPASARRRIDEALDAGRVSCGRLVREFEERFAALSGTREAVAVSSGADAVTLALAALHDRGARRGAEVIVPALSFVATGNAVFHAGFVPRFVDVRRDTLTLDVDLVEAAITPKTRALLPVHLMGKPADMDALNTLAARHDLFVVEDAAEAHGALYKGRPAGSLALMGCFSTYVAHIVSTGEGGVVTTDDEGLAEILRSLRSHGRACACRECVLNVSSGYCAKRFTGDEGEDVRFRFDRLGYSSKMNELEAALGLGMLERFDAVLEARRSNLLFFLDGMVRFAPHLVTFREEPWERLGPHAAPLVLGPEAPFTRAELSGFLERNGVETRSLFASMPTQCPGFASLGYRLGDFPEAEYLGRRGLHIGVHQGLTEAHMAYALEVVGRFLAERGLA